LSFDSYGQLTHRLDEFGNSLKVEYNLVGKDGTSRKVSSKSEIQSNKGNLINDPSFDAQVGEYHTDTQGWKKNTNTNNIVKSFDDGVFGNQCLMVRKFGSGATSIYQEIPVSPGVYKFIGYEKRRGISGNPTVRAVATYTIQRLAQGSEVGELDNSGNAWVSDTVTTTSTTGSLSGTTHEWQKFELSVTIPTGATSCSIKLEVYATHTTGDLFVDDFQLSQSEQAVNYNLIPNGYFEKDTSTTPTGWQHENLSVQDVLIISNSEEPYTSFIGNRKMRFTSDFTKTKKLYKAFDIYGSAGDEFLISGWFEGKVTGNEEAFMKAVVSYDTKPAETFIFSLNPNDDGWQNVTRGFVAKDAYHGIEISIEHRGIYELCFDALQLYLNSSSNIYQYDDMGNMMDYMKSQSSNESIRNASGEVLISTNDQGETHRYTYDDKKQLTLVKDNKGNRVRNTYDSKGNQTKMELESSLGKMTHNMTFNTKNQLTKIIDEFGFETNYIYDDENRSSEVINPLGHKDKSEYNEFDQLIKIIKESASGTNESLSYVYDDARNLKKIIVDANTRYEFFYDVYNQLIEVKLNNYTIVKYEYNLKQQMIKQTYGSSGDYYEFAYDEKDRLKTIKLNGLMSSLCTYTYDDFNRIAKVNYKGVTTNYSYDRSGKLIRKTDSQGQSERFIYDNIDSIQKSTIDINGMVRSFEYIMPYETSQDNFDGFLNRLDKAYSDERITTIAGEKAQTGMTPFFKYNYTIEESLDFPYSFIQFGNPGAQANYNLNYANTRRSYHLADHSKFDYAQWKAKFDKKKTAYGWFNVNANRTYRQRLLTFGTYQYSKWMILSLETNNTLRITSGAQVIDIPSSVFSYSHKPWSFISWQIETINQSIKLRIFIDGVSIPEQTINLVDGTTPILVSDMTQFGVGYTVTRGYEEDCPVDPFKVMYLAVGAYDYSEEEISKIYNLSLPYFEQAQIRKQRSGVLYHDHEAYDGFDVTTLKGTLVSEKGIQPESYGYQAASYKLDKSKLFEYDDLRKIHVYGSYEDNVKDLGSNKAKLVYDFNLKNEGTISLRFKPKMLTSDLRTILSLQKGTETPLGLYVNSVNQLCLTLSQFESLSVPVNHDAWNHLVISWSGTSLWIYLNNNQMIPKTKSVSFDQCKLSIGSLINNLEPTYHFNGQFEMLAYSDQVVDTTKVNQLRTSYQTVSVELVYDYLGRKEKEEIKVGTQTLESNMTYKSPGVGKTSMQVESLETYIGENITYVYDDLGNVIHMDTADGIYDYEYDYMGRLILEYNPVLDQTIKIEYNKQNIAYKRYYVGKTTTIDKEMEFLTNSENQLLFVDTIKDANVVSLPLTYPSSYLGNPTMIGSKTLSWEGRKLIAIPSDNVSYAYNEQGIRTKKIVDGVETKYHLKGSNIIAETTNSVTTFFIYNEQDELVGFEYNNNHYFYVRDLLGKITEVIDKNGTVMVSYKYDAWGKWINKDTASNGTTLGDTLVTVNPFIYKGYYYDSETDWYYLKSRYYCPVLSRFINLDNTNYLEPGSIDGVNLFAYCGNNPIKHIDGSGTSFWDVLKNVGKVIGGTAVAFVGTTIAVASLAVSKVPGSGFITELGVSLAMYGGFVVGSVFDSQIQKDMNDIGWNPFNSDESLVISSSKVSFYKGQAVIRGNFPGCASFGVMFVDKGNWVNADTIKHEYGHFIQLGILGLPKFTLGIAIPSLIGTQTYKGHYESQLWERTADWFGGANNGPYNKNSLGWSILYFLGLLLL
jgi:RHS repeat-associated protein